MFELLHRGNVAIIDIKTFQRLYNLVFAIDTSTAIKYIVYSNITK
jgi:hypothetical protein